MTGVMVVGVVRPLGLALPEAYQAMVMLQRYIYR